MDKTDKELIDDAQYNPDDFVTNLVKSQVGDDVENEEIQKYIDKAFGILGMNKDNLELGPKQTLDSIRNAKKSEITDLDIDEDEK